MLKIPVLLTLIGATACAAPVTDGAICEATRNDAPALSDALFAHPETPDAVGEPAVGILISLSICPASRLRR